MATKSKLQSVEGAELMAVEGGHHHHCHQQGGGGFGGLGRLFGSLGHVVLNLNIAIINVIGNVIGSGGTLAVGVTQGTQAP